MFGWLEVSLWCAAVVLIVVAMTPRLRPFRAFAWGAAVLALITSLLPRPGNALGQYLFGGESPAPRLPSELFGVAWWVLGAWLINSALDLVLSRTLFPRDNEPHARRLFADLASGVIYIVAFVGMMETVFHQPMSAILATSGVLAIVLGFALQSTLGDVLSGLAINIDRPFGAGDWISVSPDIEGEVVEINWRSTRLRTWLSDLIVIPNSLVAKAVVTNHSRLRKTHRSSIFIKIDHTISSTRVMALLEAAANATPSAPALAAEATAIAFSKSLITYQLSFASDRFATSPAIQSGVIERVAAGLRAQGIPVGILVTDIRIVEAPRSVRRAAELPLSGTPPLAKAQMPLLPASGS